MADSQAFHGSLDALELLDYLAETAGPDQADGPGRRVAKETRNRISCWAENVSTERRERSLMAAWIRMSR